MSKLIAAAAAGLLMLGLTGCDEDKKAAAASDKRPEMKAAPDANAVPRSALSSQDTPAELAAARDAQNKQLAAAGQQTGNVNVDKSKLDKLFDNNGSKGRLSATPVSAPSQEEMNRKAQLINANLPVYKNTPPHGSGDGDAPKRDTIPSVPLPDPSAVSGDSNVRGGGDAIVSFDAFLNKAFNAAGKAFSRAAWHAGPSTAREGRQNPTRVTVHHTDSAKQTMTIEETLKTVKNIQDFHQGPEKWVVKNGKRVNVGGRDWGDIGYHFLVDGAGNVVEGRHADVVGAHVYAHNVNNLGIANIGDYNRDHLTPAQKDALERLILFLALKYKVDPGQKGFIHGHHDFSQNDTDCPGPNVESFFPELRAFVDAKTKDVIARGGGGGFKPLLVSLGGSST